eukprot:jgi/Orpsp1_1/1183210/evm.model.c7180000084262.1
MYIIGYKCCSNGISTTYKDECGKWRIENNEWCGIIENKNCWSERLGYPCCKTATKIIYIDEDGSWSFENNEWCGIIDSVITTTTSQKFNSTKKTKASYSVIYNNKSKLKSGYDNWGWESIIGFKNETMIINLRPIEDNSEGGGISFKKLNGKYGKRGSIHFDIKTENKVNISVIKHINNPNL